MSASDHNLTARAVVSQVEKAYANGAQIYAGNEPGEDDPEWREACRSAFTERLTGRHVLEIGCGPGTDAYALSLRGLDVVATDICPEFVDIVGKRYPHLKVRVLDFTQSRDVESFDGIYGHSCFLHVPKELALQALKNLKAMLNPESALFLSLIESSKVEEYTIENWIGIENNPAMFFCYKRDEMKTLFQIAGFQQIEILDLTWSDSSAYGLPAAKARIKERGLIPYQIIGRV